MPPLLEKFIHEEEEVDNPVRYLPIRHVYSSTTPCVSSSGSSNVVSKKVRARKLIVDEEEEGTGDEKQMTDLFNGGLRWGNADRPIFVYSRRLKKPRGILELEGSAAPVVKSELFSDTESENAKDKENEERDDEKNGNDGNLLGTDGHSVFDGSRRRNRRRMKFELLNLGAVLADPDGVASGEVRRRGSRRLLRVNPPVERNMGRSSLKESSDSRIAKKWVELVSILLSLIYLAQTIIWNFNYLVLFCGHRNV